VEASQKKKRGQSEYSFSHYLYLLAELSQPDHLILLRACLARCFTQLAEAADQIVATTIFQPG
jgi:hypothetical protein